MPTITIVAEVDGSLYRIDAERTDNPHLFVHPRAGVGSKRWTVTHAPTGTSLEHFDELEDAFRYAEVTAEDSEAWDFGTFGDTITGQPPGLWPSHCRAIQAVRRQRNARKSK